MPATATTMVRSIWQNYFYAMEDPTDADKEADKDAGDEGAGKSAEGAPGVAREVDDDEEDEEREDDAAEDALAGDSPGKRRRAAGAKARGERASSAKVAPATKVDAAAAPAEVTPGVKKVCLGVMHVLCAGRSTLLSRQAPLWHLTLQSSRPNSKCTPLHHVTPTPCHHMQVTWSGTSTSTDSAGRTLYTKAQVGPWAITPGSVLLLEAEVEGAEEGAEGTDGGYVYGLVQCMWQDKDGDKLAQVWPRRWLGCSAAAASPPAPLFTPLLLLLPWTCTHTPLSGRHRCVCLYLAWRQCWVTQQLMQSCLPLTSLKTSNSAGPPVWQLCTAWSVSGTPTYAGVSLTRMRRCAAAMQRPRLQVREHHHAPALHTR